MLSTIKVTMINGMMLMSRMTMDIGYFYADLPVDDWP